MASRSTDPQAATHDPELLAHAEHSLIRATFRLGRLRTRNRGSQLHRDLTAVFYDIQVAREAIAAVLNPPDTTAVGSDAESRTES